MCLRAHSVFILTAGDYAIVDSPTLLLFLWFFLCTNCESLRVSKLFLPPPTPEPLLPAEQRQTGKVICPVFSLTACGRTARWEREQRAAVSGGENNMRLFGGKKKREKGPCREIERGSGSPLFSLDVCVGAPLPEIARVFECEWCASARHSPSAGLYRGQ